MAPLKPVVVVIEDDAQIRRLLRGTLKAHGFDVREASNGKRGLILAASCKPDLFILDLSLPDVGGLEVLRKIREWWTTRPVIILSAHNTESTKVEALDAGADDYLTKPFGLHELLARIRTAMRHSTQNVSSNALPAFTAAGITVDQNRRLVLRDERAVHVTPIEYRILGVLIAHAGMVLTYEQILKQVWGPRFVKNKHYLRTYVASLREKLEVDPANPRLLLTEIGVGYRLAADESAVGERDAVSDAA
jgi:two-component system KDP operon response regulator KdpE